MLIVRVIGLVTRLAGSGQGWQDGLGTLASFDYPYGIAVDTTGQVYVTDCYNQVIRVIARGGKR